MTFPIHLSQVFNNTYQVVMITISLTTEEISYIQGMS